MRHGWLLAVLAACSAWREPRPPPPSCSEVGEHVYRLVGNQDPRQRASGIRDAFARRCLDDSWGESVRQCVLATRTLGDRRGCKRLLTSDQRGKLDRELAQVARQPIERWVPAVCTEYGSLLDSLDDCNGMPAQAHRALAQTYAKLVASWASKQIDTPALETQCRAMTQTLRKAMVTTCAM